jgi:hypothetical protein
MLLDDAMRSFFTKNLFISGVAFAFALASTERGAAASQSPSAGGDSTSETSSTVTVEQQPANVIGEPLLLPQHPHLRGNLGGSFGVGVYCPLLGTGSVGSGQFCSFRARMGIDFFFGDFHFGAVAGEVMAGGFAGLELGTPYFRLGSRRSIAALAIRASFDATVTRLLKTVPGRLDGGIVSFDHSYGPNFSFALAQNFTLDWRLAVGGTLASFFTPSHVASPIHALMFESTIGVRY